MKKLKITNYEPTNSDRVIGKVVEVTKEIKSNEYGEVVVFGTVWLAASDKNHKVGSKVVVQKLKAINLS